MSTAAVTLKSLSRQLGDWRSSGSEDIAYRSLANALKGLVLDGRLPLNAPVITCAKSGNRWDLLV